MHGPLLLSHHLDTLHTKPRHPPPTNFLSPLSLFLTTSRTDEEVLSHPCCSKSSYLHDQVWRCGYATLNLRQTHYKHLFSQAILMSTHPLHHHHSPSMSLVPTESDARLENEQTFSAGLDSLEQLNNLDSHGIVHGF